MRDAGLLRDARCESDRLDVSFKREAFVVFVDEQDKWISNILDRENGSPTINVATGIHLIS